MSENYSKNDYEYKSVEQDLVLPDSAVFAESDKRRLPDSLGSKRQIHGAAWAGGLTGLLIGGPIGAILLAWGGIHLAKKNSGDLGDFCRKSGDFMCRMGIAIKKEWSEATSKADEPKELS